MSLRELYKNRPKARYKLQLIEEKRSLSQNNFYWLYLGIISRETGNNENDLHEYFKRKLLPPRFVKVMGQEIKLPASTSSLKKSDFGEYMEKICAETGVPVPDPTQLENYISKY